MKNSTYKIIFALVLIASATLARAQAPSGPGGGTPSGGPPPSGGGGGAGAPIDGGASALLIGVAGYAYTHLKKKAAAASTELPN